MNGRGTRTMLLFCQNTRSYMRGKSHTTVTLRGTNAYDRAIVRALFELARFRFVVTGSKSARGGFDCTPFQPSRPLTPEAWLTPFGADGNNWLAVGVGSAAPKSCSAVNSRLGSRRAPALTE
jgi:hypothetical protein